MQEQMNFKLLGKRVRDTDSESTESEKDMSPGPCRKIIACATEDSLTPEYIQGYIGKVRQNIKAN